MCQTGPNNGPFFHPHLTLSHFINLTAAQEAQALLEQHQHQEEDQNRLSSLSPCLIREIYVLQRRGDEGQFERVATVPLLGKTKTTTPLTKPLDGTDANHTRAVVSNNNVNQEIQVHDPPLPFPGMPLVEEDWVRAERKQLQQRRNGKSRGRRRRRRRR
jgi:hypothetical protein